MNYPVRIVQQIIFEALSHKYSIPGFTVLLVVKTKDNHIEELVKRLNEVNVRVLIWDDKNITKLVKNLKKVEKVDNKYFNLFLNKFGFINSSNFVAGIPDVSKWKANLIMTYKNDLTEKEKRKLSQIFIYPQKDTKLFDNGFYYLD